MWRTIFEDSEGISLIKHIADMYESFIRSKDYFCGITLNREQVKEYIEEYERLEKILKAFEIIKEYFIFKFDKEEYLYGDVWGLLVSIQAKEDEGNWDCTATANLADYEEEFNLLKEVLNNERN